MNSEIIIYEPLLEITTWNDKKYFTAEKNRDTLVRSMNSDKFIQI
jgi:hypothetical protein